MKEKRDSQAGRKRRPYIKPEVKQVALRPEEAVLGNCKTNSKAGPVAADCNTTTCYSKGS